MPFNIAIDGPAGAGKSTIAKLLAKELGFIYVDTGGMYRTMALAFLRNGVDTENEKDVTSILDTIDISLDYDGDGTQQFFLNGENVTPFIRTELVSREASRTSAYLPVREKLVALQQKLASEKDVVMDGRDIGTAVLPGADVKVYLTASTRVRAMRRYLEMKEKDPSADPDEIEKDIIERDYQDMHREHSPLRQAEDAVMIDSSALTIEETVDAIRKLVNQKT